MAPVTPRKRKRSLDCLQSVPGNPVKKLIADFNEEPSVVKMTAGCSPKKLAVFSRDEDKENHPLHQRSARLQECDTSPVQRATVPQRIQGGPPLTMSPQTGAAYTSIVPINSFYSKGKQYRSILERKQTDEDRSLGLRIEDGNLPTANKTEKGQVKVITGRKTNSKAPKRPAASRQAKSLSKNTKKAKVDMALPKSVTGKENTNCVIEKKMETPFRVLSMKFKPMLKLKTGAAFFATGRKWHSGAEKVHSAPSFPHCASKSMIKEKKNTCQVYKQLDLSTKSRKGSHTNGSQKEEKHDNMEEEKLTHNRSQDTEIMSELNLLQETECPQTSGCLKTLAPKAADTETQTYEEISHKSSRIKHEDGTSNKLSNKTIKADDICPLFNTPSSNKKRSQLLPDEQSSLVEFSPIVQIVPTILKNSKKTKELSKDLKGQMVIDAGQKHFGAMVCKSCGMVYSAANPEDEAQHIQYHQRFLWGMKYVGWKNERVVTEFLDGKVVLVLQDDPKYAIKKAEDVRKFVDNELGFKQVVLTYPTLTQTYLFVSSEKKIVGCLIAEPVRQAFRVISEPPSVLESPTKNSLEHHRAWCCSAKPEKVICGISRIWVFSLMRRKGIASRLVDVVRRTFLFGSYLSTDEIAFSDPTPDGKLFATKYCKTPSFLVYNFLNQSQFCVTANHV